MDHFYNNNKNDSSDNEEEGEEEMLTDNPGADATTDNFLGTHKNDGGLSASFECLSMTNNKKKDTMHDHNEKGEEEMLLHSTPSRRSPYLLRNSTSAKKQVALSSYAATGAGATSSTSSLTYDRFYIGKGTEDLPYVIHVNLERPERNGPFQVVEVSHMSLGNHAYSGFEIATAIAPPDFGEYSMRVAQVLPPIFKTYASRALLCECPSQDFWIRNTTRFNNARPATKRCSHTESSYDAAANAIEFCDKKRDDRTKKYWLLLFPETVELDNRVFSNQEPILVEGDVVGMRSAADENVLDKDLFGLVIIWRIAHAHHKKRIGKKPALVADPKSITFV